MNILSEILLSAETMATTIASTTSTTLSSVDGNLLALMFGGVGIATLFIYRALREDHSQINESAAKQNLAK